MIATFPEFSPLSPEDKQFLDNFNAKYDPYADWTYGTLLVWWDSFHDLTVAKLGDNLVIRSSYPSLGREIQLCLLGTDRIDSALEQLFSFQKQHGEKRALYFVPRYTAQAIRHPERYSIVEDVDASEYIISVKMHAQPEEPTMYRVRRRLSGFRQSIDASKLETKPLDLTQKSNQSLLVHALTSWNLSYKNDSERSEEAVLYTAFRTAEVSNLQCLGLFADEVLIGFVLYRYLNPETVGAGHMKVATTYPHTFAYLIHQLALYLQREGIKYLNIEQDLGIAGLRAYKKSLRPVHIMRKYTIRPIEPA